MTPEEAQGEIYASARPLVLDSKIGSSGKRVGRDGFE